MKKGELWIVEIPSIAMIFQLRAIDKRRLTSQIGVVEKSIMNKIDVQLRRLLDV